MDKDFYSNQPQLAFVEITTKCNLNCTYCTARKLIRNPKDLELEKIKELKEKVMLFDYIVFCGLGEPFAHKNIYEVIDYFYDKKLIIVTNGSILIDFERLTKHKNVETITFSVDGAKEEDMKNICTKYDFNILLQNLEEAKRNKITCAFNSTITEKTYNNIVDIIEMISKYEIEIFKLGLPIGKVKWAQEHIAEIVEISSIIEKAMFDLGKQYESPFCIKCTHDNAPIAVIIMNGNCYPCCDYFCGRPLVGNIYQQTFEEMWIKHSYLKFRKGEYCENCKNFIFLERYRKLLMKIETEKSISVYKEKQ
ncbi:MAG: radical SAM protein [Lachnospiraceae bacterium]|nr:radical SAM protein [Lachnospiraceae bacterium]